MTPAPASLDSWRAGVASLDLGAQPCPGVSLVSWPEIVDGFRLFLDAWGERALAAGWSTEALFGVHRAAGAYRADSTGALVTNRQRRVVAVQPGLIRLQRGDSIQTDRGLPYPGESVPIWLFRWAP